jgi:hypothetical protein
MIIIGYILDSEEFYKIDNFNSIRRTSPNSVVFQKFSKQNLDIYKELKDNDVNFALKVSNLLEIVLANNLGAKYIIVDAKLSELAQKTADNYMFDSKILVEIFSENEIEKYIKKEIDGVIFKSHLKNIEIN